MSDDGLTYEIDNKGNDEIAFVKNDSLNVYETGEFDLIATDTKGQKVTVPMNFEQYITLVGETIDLAQDTSLNASNTYITTEPDFISKRVQGNISFTIFNKDNTFISDLVSDADGNYSVKLPAKGKYGIEIKTDDLHPMMYMVILDSIRNNENIAGIDTSFSKFNFAQSHMGCYPEKILDPVNGVEGKLVIGAHMRTYNWDPKIIEKGLKFLFLTKDIDSKTGELGDTVTQDMNDIIINGRKQINPYFNNFFDNENIIFVDDNSRFGEDGVVTARYFTNKRFGGSNGKTIKNGVIVSADVGINKDVYDYYKLYGTDDIFTINFTENASMLGAFFEGWVEEKGKPSNWYKGSPYTSALTRKYLSVFYSIKSPINRLA